MASDLLVGMTWQPAPRDAQLCAIVRYSRELYRAWGRVRPAMRHRASLGIVILVVGAATLAVSAADDHGRQAAVGMHHVHGLAVDRRDPNIVYLATHTGLVRLRPSGPPEWIGAHRFDLMGFTAHPTAPDVFYASGHPDLPTFRQDGMSNLGLLVSVDRGETWRSVAFRGTDFHALAYSPRNEGELYGWSVAGERGLHRISVRTWTVERVAGRGLADVLGIAASPDPGGPLFAATEGGLLLSRDHGVSWAPATGLGTGVRVSAVAFHLKDAHVVYAYVARAGAGLMRSHDAGKVWEAVRPSGVVTSPAVALAVGPGRSVVMATADASVLRSHNGGRSWDALLTRGRPGVTERTPITVWRDREHVQLSATLEEYR